MKRTLLLAALGSLVFLVLGTPVYAQGESSVAQGESSVAQGVPVVAQRVPVVWTADATRWALIAGAFALALAAASGAYSQGRAAAAACEAISRNPGAAPQIRFTFLLGVVLIESLVIYVFVISLSILFVKWPAL